MSLKEKIPLFFFIITVSVWFISLLLIYLPISPWSGPVFPKSVDPSMMSIFLVMTALSTSASLMMGFREIRQHAQPQRESQEFRNTENKRSI
jgi:heme/copper-type cytochrome/quinol oxidase subunit 3